MRQNLHGDVPGADLRDEEQEKMRILDQIDPSAGALRSWQAESERLVFDQRAGTRRVQGEQGETGCQSAAPPTPAAGWRRSIIQLVEALVGRRPCRR